MEIPVFNVAVVSGVLSSDAQVRELASGDVVVSYEVTVRVEGDTSSVPVAWFGAGDKAVLLHEGDAVVAVGSVRRRFFTAGGRTQSRTELVADRVHPARRRKQAAAAVQRALGHAQLT